MEKNPRAANIHPMKVISPPMRIMVSIPPMSISKPASLKWFSPDFSASQSNARL